MTDERNFNDELNKEDLDEVAFIDDFEEDNDLETQNDDEIVDAMMSSRDSSELFFKSSFLKVNPYTPEEEKEAFIRLREAKLAGDEELYKEIFDDISIHNLRLITKIAAKYSIYTKNLTYEDLMIEGYFGLRKGIELYNLDYGYRFSTYALHWVRQSVARAIMNVDDLVRLPVHIQEKLHKFMQMNEEDREQTLQENKALREAWALKDPTSLDITVGEEDSHDVTYFGDFIPSGESTDRDAIKNIESEEFEKIISDSIDAYCAQKRDKNRDRAKDILYARFGFDGSIKTLQELGDKYNVSRERIRQVEAAYLKFVRHSRYMRLFANYIEEHGVGGTFAERFITNREDKKKRAERESTYREFLKKGGYDYVEISKQLQHQRGLECETDEEDDFDLDIEIEEQE